LKLPLCTGSMACLPTTLSHQQRKWSPSSTYSTPWFAPHNQTHPWWSISHYTGIV